MEKISLRLLPRFLWLIVMWAALTLFYIPLWVAGAIMVPWATFTKRYDRGIRQDGPCYVWTDKFMRLWETHDNGCCPDWYIKRFGSNRPLWLNIIIWSAFRNACGGNPSHIYDVPADKVRYWGTQHPSGDAIKHFLATGERKWHWRFLQYGWRVGFWASYPFMRQYEKDPNDKFDVIDIQHGYKRNANKTDSSVINLVFSPWDSGRRRN